MMKNRTEDMEISESLKNEIAKARIRSAEERKQPCADRVRYVKRLGKIMVYFTDGFEFGFPVSFIRELRNASDEEIENVELSELGDALHWDNLDAHYTILGLLAGVYGNKAWMRELGKRGGRVTSEAKIRAAHRNGLRGGRPPSHPKAPSISGVKFSMHGMSEAHRSPRTASKSYAKKASALTSSARKPSSTSTKQSASPKGGKFSARASKTPTRKK